MPVYKCSVQFQEIASTCNCGHHACGVCGLCVCVCARSLHVCVVCGDVWCVCVCVWLLCVEHCVLCAVLCLVRYTKHKEVLWTLLQKP